MYITGLKNWNSDEIFPYIEKNLKGRVKILGYISEEELIAFYQIAEIYIYPSLYEGFGLPILEAQACGCPVLTSSETSCPEVAGKGALIVNPYSVDSIADGIYSILDNSRMRKKLINAGYENLKRFSWSKTTSLIIKSFEG